MITHDAETLFEPPLILERYDSNPLCFDGSIGERKLVLFRY
jgi:hypothetical protein